MEIKNKLAKTRGERGLGNGERREKVNEGTCVKDPWTRTLGGGLNVGGGRWVGQRD